MIIETKENGSNKELADKLKELLNNLPDNHPKRKFIEADYYKLLAGNSGEKGVEYNFYPFYDMCYVPPLERYWPYRRPEDVIQKLLSVSGSKKRS